MVRGNESSDHKTKKWGDTGSSSLGSLARASQQTPVTFLLFQKGIVLKENKWNLVLFVRCGK